MVYTYSQEVEPVQNCISCHQWWLVKVSCLLTQSHVDHVIGRQDERSLMEANVVDTVLVKGRSCACVLDR